MKKLLVTGGAGFIGSEFVRQGVKEGHSMIVIDKLTYAGDIERIKTVKKEIDFYHVDITDKESVMRIFKAKKPDVVVHFAAETHVDRSILDAFPFLDTNVKGTYVLLDISKDYGLEKFINISTDEVYGELGEEGQFYETTSVRPNSPYSASKAASDLFVRAYHRTYKLPTIIIRPSNNYGPFQYPEKLIPVVISRAGDNKSVPVYANGDNIREWLYVEDCAAGILTVVNKGKIGEIYNIGSGQERRNIDVVKGILSILGRSERLIEYVQDRPGHDFRYSLNSDKIKNELDFIAQTKFEDGLKKTVKWFLGNEWWWRKFVN